MGKTKQERLSDAIDALASLYEFGHLQACTYPEDLLMTAVEEIRAGRELRRAVGAHLGEEVTCERAEKDESPCDSSACTYCRMARCLSDGPPRREGE